MERRDRITRSLSKEHRGIEIGPYHNPLMPKRLGYDCLVLDVFTAQTLRENAAKDTNIPKETIPNIEEVDLVGSCTRIADLVAEKYPLGSFDYVVSSHNFEHMPDPIRFIQGCQRVLKPGGLLSMAVPDRRTCFDYFRPYSVLSELLEAYFEHRERPTAATLFLQNALHSRYYEGDRELVGFFLENDPSKIIALRTLEIAYQNWQAFRSNPDEIYRDAHCWAFTPASLELILRDLRYLNVIQMDIEAISEAFGNEFYIQLRNLSTAPAIDRESFYDYRQRLLHRINDEASENSMRSFQRRNPHAQGSNPSPK